MNDGFKQRLVGAIVLVVVALILWPVIFSDPNSVVMDRSSQIPPKPAFEKYQMKDPVRPHIVQPVSKPKPDTAAVKPAAKAQAKIKAKPETTTRLNKDGLPEAWVLQVASFTQPKKADELKQALQKQGYKAFTRVIATKESKLRQVFIGPRFTKDAFNKDKNIIDKRYKVKSLIVKFEQ